MVETEGLAFTPTDEKKLAAKINFNGGARKISRRNRYYLTIGNKRRQQQLERQQPPLMRQRHQ
jgi:hypothetical protein